MRRRGVKLPSSLIIPSTNVAESADVTKNETMSRSATMERTGPSGKCESMANSTLSEGSAEIAYPSSSTEVDIVPNVANHRQEKIAGIKMTQVRNSRMLLPREMRAMNTPTKGDHAIHHAQ